MSLSRFLKLATHWQLLPLLESGQETLVGGQAVLEGVMMCAPHSYCVAVRRKNGELATTEAPLVRISEKYPIFKLPFLRGIGTMFRAMQLGTKALQFSANVAMEDENEKEAQGNPGKSDNMLMWAMIFSLLVMFTVFKFVPLSLATLIGHYVPALSSRFAVNMTDGVIRMVILVGYMFAISLAKDIRRVFQYHGAEHKVVFNYESGQPVNIPNAQAFQTFHPRCGTSFILVIFGIAMVVYALIPVDGFLMKLLVRFLLLLPLAGVSYEVIRFAAKRQNSWLGMITVPGLWLQRITTKQPDDTQAAVAIHALEGAMKLEEKQGGELVIA